jgi:hypothetical protein
MVKAWYFADDGTDQRMPHKGADVSLGALAKIGEGACAAAALPLSGRGAARRAVLDAAGGRNGPEGVQVAQAGRHSLRPWVQELRHGASRSAAAALGGARVERSRHAPPQVNIRKDTFPNYEEKVFCRQR